MTPPNTVEPENLGAKVTACLLTYNHRHVLPRVLESLECQTLGDFELIISDDGSSDGTWQYVSDWCSSRSWAKAIKNNGSSSMASNANHAFSESDTPFVALLHHDDLYRRDLLEKWARLLHKNPSAGFVFNAYGFSDDEPPKVEDVDRLIDGPTFLKDELLLDWGCPVRGTAMIRKSAFEAVGGFNEEFGSIADVDLWMRLSASYDVGYVREPLIEVNQDRPDEGYPEEYSAFSWDRRRRLYEIHGQNLARLLSNERSIWTNFALLRYRWMVSLDRLKWLLYAVAKDKNAMIENAHVGENPYEFQALKWLVEIFRLLFGKR